MPFPTVAAPVRSPTSWVQVSLPHILASPLVLDLKLTRRCTQLYLDNEKEAGMALRRLLAPRAGQPRTEARGRRSSRENVRDNSSSSHRPHRRPDRGFPEMFFSLIMEGIS